MAKKNPLIAQYKAELDRATTAGLNMGLQLSSDCYQMALNDPAVMGKDVLGSGRMLKVMEAAEANVDYFIDAVDYRVPEADVLQEKMDARLRKIWGDKLQVFYERYPWLKRVSYEGGKRK